VGSRLPGYCLLLQPVKIGKEFEKGAALAV